MYVCTFVQRERVHSERRKNEGKRKKKTCGIWAWCMCVSVTLFWLSMSDLMWKAFVLWRENLCFLLFAFGTNNKHEKK
jgi:hypothetical protein